MPKAKKKPRTSLPKGKQVQREDQQPERFAYIINDAAFGTFMVRDTFAWWKEQAKVQKLIDAYKIDANDSEACFYAGIKLHQLEYFIEQHPEFSEIRQICQGYLMLAAKQKLAREVETNPAAAMAYIKYKQDREKRNEDARRRKEEDEKKLLPPPTTNAIVYADFSEEGMSAEDVRAAITGEDNTEDHADSE